jgi:cell fate (sporulation/competence/biofilm development) regulator YlbF (YheA/YmcA/DUF963 family)
MNSKILDLAHYTLRLVQDICEIPSEDYKKIENAKQELESAVSGLKNLKKFIKCYMKLKYELLAVYKKIFDTIKKEI